MKKLKRLVATGLAVTTAVATMSINVIAASNDIGITGNVNVAYQADTDVAFMDDSEFAIFVIEDNEIKQIIPVDNVNEEYTVELKENTISVISTDGEKTKKITLNEYSSDTSDRIAVLGQKCTINRDNVPLLAVAAANAEVYLTLEKGVTFWRSTTMGAYSYGCVSVGTSTYTYGYVLSIYLDV